MVDFNVLLIGYLTLFVLMIFVWLISLYTKNAGVVDVFWGMGIIVFTWNMAISVDGFLTRKLFLLYIVSLWGTRLSWHILIRLRREKEEDARYQLMRQTWKANPAFNFFLFFQFQAILQAILAFPFYFVLKNTDPNFDILEWLGLAVWLLGVCGETVSDAQLKQFKSNPNNKGRVCDVGLWYYSRHPNYFFEWVIWVGFFIFMLGSPYGFIGIISPLLMLFLLLKVSGVPLAEEQSLKSRGDLYRAYQKSTSVFIPLPKRK